MPAAPSLSAFSSPTIPACPHCSDDFITQSIRVGARQKPWCFFGLHVNSTLNPQAPAWGCSLYDPYLTARRFRSRVQSA